MILIFLVFIITVSVTDLNLGIRLLPGYPGPEVLLLIHGVFHAIKFFYTHFWREGERSEKKITNFDKNNF